MALVSAVTPFFLLALLPLTAAYVWLQRYYVTNARELQRLESMARSPIYAHFAETLVGAITIRAQGQQARFRAANTAFLDANVAAYFTGTSANRWLAVRLETLGAAVTTASALFAVLARSSTDPTFPALAGLSVATALSVTQSLNWLIRMSSDMETQVVSVERIAEYAALPSEEVLKAVERTGAPPLNAPPPGWPSAGEIVIAGLRLAYRPSTPLVLQGVDLHVRGGERLGVVGRTGSGKSSLVAALYRTPDVQEGTILVDGVDIAQLSLRDLRRIFTIIQQEPTLLSGTVRDNLDFAGDEFSDAQLWEVLDKVALRAAIERLPGGLQASIREGGAPLSLGQRQLLTVARALLRRRRIVILDEASSSVDVETDALLQATVRRELQGITVLTIAHRVHTILDSDRIVVMADGCVREVGRPGELARDPGSAFAALLRDSQV